MRAVVVGNGMVGQRFCEALAEQDRAERWRIDVIAEEPVAAYDRVRLSTCFEGADPQELTLVADGFYDHPHRHLHLGAAATAVDLEQHMVATTDGGLFRYDALVLATGSRPFVPPVPGADGPQCAVYRTLGDVDHIRRLAAGSRTGVVIGGGLLGLEAANALRLLGLDTSVVELAPHLMPVQLDGPGGAALAKRIADMGIDVHTGTGLQSVEDGGVCLADGRRLEGDVVVFAAGVRPIDEPARSAGIAVHERGGILVDERCTTSDPSVWAIGECAVAAGRIWGLVQPGYEMATVVAANLCGSDRSFLGADMSTKLKLLGVDVASVGDAHGSAPGTDSIVLDDQASATYKRVNVDSSGRVTGAILVGDAAAYPTLVAMVRGDLPSSPEPASLIAPAGSAAAAVGVAGLPDAAPVCSCNSVCAGDIRRATSECDGNVAAVRKTTLAGTSCGGCGPLVADLVAATLKATGVVKRRVLCEHFDWTRQELFDLVRVNGLRTFDSILVRHGHGRGCEVCRPAIASMLASLSTGYVLDGGTAALQDTNDHFLANLQRDGTYSVVPRIPGGEITPEGLIAIGEVARDFGLYSKITGGQRIDLFGARVEQLPAIWEQLVAAGFESGHAYGKAVRTVKSCVGSTWCRYGVQDSVQLAIDLELRYRGLRAPHKIKLAVSGCARECAEAQSKDVGVIATEKGWNLYVGGNGGQRPRHAQLLASDLTTEEVFTFTDRFLAYYIQTADRLERTANWLENLDGGMDHVRRVVIDDSLGVAAELDALIAEHVDNYRCEWAETLADPDRRALFTSFVNDPGPDPNVVFITERGQRRPARADEKPAPMGVAG